MTSRPPTAVGVEAGELGQVDAAGLGEEPVDQLGADVGRDPAGRAVVVAPGPPALVLDGLEPDLGGLDAQRGVVGHDHGRAVRSLAERGGQDAVVGLGRVEPLGRDLVEHQPVGLDAQGAAAGQLHGVADVAAVGHPQLLDRPYDLPCRPTDVVHARLVLVELLDDDQRDHRVGIGEGEQRVGIGDEHGRVEHHPNRRVGSCRSG